MRVLLECENPLISSGGVKMILRLPVRRAVILRTEELDVMQWTDTGQKLGHPQDLPESVGVCF